MIRNIGIEEGGRILTDGNRTIKFERVDQGYEMYELSGNRYTRCDEMEEEIDDQDAIEDMKEQCGNTDLEDSIRQYKYLLEEYTENKKGE